jgi:hypothetical protein
MNKIKTKIVIFIVFLTLIALLGLLRAQSYTPMSTQESQEGKVAGLFIQYRDGITELEVKNILENCNLTMYKLDYNVYGMEDRYYIIVDKNKIMDVRGELRKEENWTESSPTIEKENYYIIMISYQAIRDKNFIEMLNKYNIQVKSSVWCHVIFTDRPWSGISEKNANELKRELEMNENIFTVYFESIKS